MSRWADSRPALAVVTVGPGVLRALPLLISSLTAAAGDTTCGPTIQVGLRTCTIPAPGSKDAFSWGVLLGIGTEGAQVCAIPSTVVNDTIIMSSEICEGQWLAGRTPEQCRSRRGGFIHRDKLPNASIDGLADNNPGWKTLMGINEPRALDAFEHAARAVLTLRDHNVTMIEGLATQGEQSSLSHIGLGEKSTLLHALKDAGLIGALSWGLNSGSQSAEFPRDGNLVLGGYDDASIDGNLDYYDIAVPNLVNDRPCPLQITLAGLNVTIYSGDGSKPTDEQSYVGKSGKYKVCIEPYDNLFRFPSEYIDRLKSQISPRFVAADKGPLPESSYPDIYNLEPGLVYNTSDNFKVTMKVSFDNGLTVTIPSHEMVRPLRGIDKNGVPQAEPGYREVAVYAAQAPEDAVVLGKAFLSQNNRFALARQSQGAGTPLVKSSAVCASESRLSTTEKGLIAGVSALAAVLFGFVGFWVYKKLFVPLAGVGGNGGGDGIDSDDGSGSESEPPNPVNLP
ncbi:hypothetical protein C8A03DRAFT_38945 [Achaetomium macrosporum]|uniref:Uncharacterized protein n=1 Tax=Achaetomium macrosporum TaxID=79813 RepID=A0AAN7C106_9PEZI|nr:hypothetical protein C8A03DRAFT_38945 [Achaetomium macrosporum]